ncbi:hypothetical protein [Pseudomonas kitaguniensis]|uniref:hypothetical protein n=1 Tax=Pseudomonas kitaguniensis TaxID=2607908 RepID=UPI003B9E96EC
MRQLTAQMLLVVGLCVAQGGVKRVGGLEQLLLQSRLRSTRRSAAYRAGTLPRTNVSSKAGLSNASASVAWGGMRVLVKVGAFSPAPEYRPRFCRLGDGCPVADSCLRAVRRQIDLA